MEPEKQEQVLFHKQRKRRHKNFNKNFSKYPEIRFSKSQHIMNTCWKYNALIKSIHLSFDHCPIKNLSNMEGVSVRIKNFPENILM